MRETNHLRLRAKEFSTGPRVKKPRGIEVPRLMKSYAKERPWKTIVTDWWTLSDEEIQELAVKAKNIIDVNFNGSEEKHAEFLSYLDMDEKGLFTLADLYYALGRTLLG